jgi:cell division protein ZipA
MAAELRWILLGFSLLLLGGIWWWGSRRSAQAPGNAALREINPTPAVQRAEARAEVRQDAHADAVDPMRTASHETQSQPNFPEPKSPEPKSPEWVSPFEPLSIRATGYEDVPVLDGPMMVYPETAPAAARPVVESLATPPAPSVPAARPAVPTLMPDQLPEAAEQQKIVTLRVCAAGESRWPGTTLLSALELHGLAYGRYQVFHRRHVDGRSLFCVASLGEPGTFDVARMASEEFRGVTMFAVMPGPAEPLATVDELFAAARGLAQELSGMVQDSKGLPFSPQRAAALREDVARFQASLPRG